MTRRKTGAQFNAEIKRLTKQLDRKYKTDNTIAIDVKKTMIERKIKYLEKARDAYDTALTLEGQARKDQFQVAEKNKLEASLIKPIKFSVNKVYDNNFNLQSFKELYTLNYKYEMTSEKGDVRLTMSAESRFNQMFIKQLWKQGYIKDPNNVEEVMNALEGYTPSELYEIYKMRGGKWEKFDYDKLANDEGFIKQLIATAELQDNNKSYESNNTTLFEFRQQAGK